MLNSIKKVTSNTISKTVISSHLESPINQTLKPSSINNINTIQPLLPDHSFNLQNNQTQPNNHGQKHIEYQSIIPNLHNVKYNQLLSIPASPNDKTLLNEHLCLFNAYIRLYDPLSAEILLHKLHRYNYGNFRQSSQVKHLNDLIEAYLQIDSIQGTKSDHDKARQIYEQKKFTFKPNVDTFALFSTYYMKHEMIEQMINLLIDMKTLGVSLKMLVEHYRFQNEIDLALLTTFMKKCNSPIDHIVEANCEIKNLLLDTAQEDFDQEEYELSKMNDSIETSDKQSNEGLKLILSDSVNVVQLEKTLSNFRQDTSDLFKLQETLELESRTLAIIEEEGNLDNLPEYLQKFTGHSRQLIREWHASLLPYIRNELKHPTLSLQLRPFLKLLKPEKIALLTIICFLHVPSSTEQKAGEVMGRIKLTALSVAIGSSIETEINSQALTKHIDKQKTKGAMYDLHVKGKLVDPRLRNVAMDMARRELEKRNTWMPKWSPTVTIGIGSLLASLVVMSAKFKSQPATHLSL